VRALVEALGSGVVRFDGSGRVVYLNPAAEALTGWTLEAARGHRLIEIYPEAAAGARWLNDGRPSRLLDAAGYAVVPASENRLTRADGSQVVVRERWAPVEGGGGWLVLEDVSELRRLEERIEWQAHHDPTTGLMNRRGFEEALRSAIEDAMTLGCEHAFGCLELEDLDVVVDALGQAAGDELLRQVAEVLSQHLHDGEVLGRISEERFGLLFKHCPPPEMERRSRELRRAVSRARFTWQGERFSAGVTLGAVPIDAEGGDLYELLGAADAALMVARDETGQIHRFNPDDSQDIRLAEHYGEMRWLGRIDRALRKDQFRLYRQPIVSASSPRVAEAPLHEVLIRMLDDDGRVISPGVFIPAAERFQVITTLDRWVVRRALQKLAQTEGGEGDGAVTLNLSGQSIGDSSFLDFVLGELAGSGVDPWRLCFEITETAAVSNLERAQQFMSRLKDRGCRFILDDFGSGMSSFAYLKNLPVDFLKIDGGFVREMLDDPVQHAIVHAVHQVGHVLGVATIAEMIESRDQLDAVDEIGIDYVQGFFIRHPEPWDV